MTQMKSLRWQENTINEIFIEMARDCAGQLRSLMQMPSRGEA
jgi:hypothetical protein